MDTKKPLLASALSDGHSCRWTAECPRLGLTPPINYPEDSGAAQLLDECCQPIGRGGGRPDPTEGGVGTLVLFLPLCYSVSINSVHCPALSRFSQIQNTESNLNPISFTTGHYKIQSMLAVVTPVTFMKFST